MKTSNNSYCKNVKMLFWGFHCVLRGFSLVLYTQGYLPCKSAFINATLSAKLKKKKQNILNVSKQYWNGANIEEHSDSKKHAAVKGEKNAM